MRRNARRRRRLPPAPAGRRAANLVGVRREARIVAARHRLVQHNASHVQAVAKCRRRDQRLQHVVDRAERITGDDEQRKAELICQIGDVFIDAQRRHQPASTFDEDDVGTVEPHVESAPQHRRVEPPSLGHCRQMWSERRCENLRADFGQRPRLAGSFPQGNRVVGHQHAIAQRATARCRLVDPDAMFGRKRPSNHRRDVRLANAGIRAGNE